MQFGDPRLPERFWAKVQPEPMSGCWLWVGTLTNDGYGLMWTANGMVRSHRVSFLVENEIPAKFVVDHKCRVRCCVNPAHLRAVTDRENILVGTGSSAMFAKRTTCANGHYLSGDNLRLRHDRGRRCRICSRAYRARQRAKRASTGRAA